jgi:transcriptional regulator with XRE-family HTH domain
MVDYEKLRDIRKKAGNTQETLATAIGINRATISKYESGVIEPPVLQIQQIAKILGVSWYELYDEEDKKFFDYAREKNRRYREGVQRKEHLTGLFDQLNDIGQQKAIERVEELTEIPKYQRPAQPTEATQDAPEDK